MISIDLGTIEYYDDDNNQFVYDNGGIVRFEYSLKVVYEWENKYRKSFLKGELTEQEMIDFCMMMALDPMEEKFLTADTIKILAEFIKDTKTATVFSSAQNNQNNNDLTKKGKLYTAEEIYAIMFQSGIPIEFENRNLNSLFVILKIIGHHNNPPKKMSQQDILRQNAKLNAERKAKMKTKG